MASKSAASAEYHFWEIASISRDPAKIRKYPHRRMYMRMDTMYAYRNPVLFTRERSMLLLGGEAGQCHRVPGFPLYLP
jgi:hypothetical protein